VSDPVPLIDVRGGSHGVAVGYEQARALASAYDGAGNRLRDWAGTGGRVLCNGDLLESALLSPRSFAEAELTVLGATTGPDGVLVESVAWETDAVLIRATVTAFETTDQVVAATFEVIDYAVGRTVGFAVGAGLPVLVPAAVVTGLLGYATYQALPPALQQEARAAATTGAATLEAWVAEHPWLLERLANGGGGLVDGFWSGVTGQPVVGPDGRLLFHATTEDAALLLAGFYPDDGVPQVVRREDLAPHGPGSPDVPSSLAELLAHLRQVSLLSGDPDSPDNGTIEVQTVHGPDGPRHVVYLPGTDDMLTTPWSRDDDVRDLPTNFAAVGGASTTYADGILAAMARAGIEPGEPVALVGHSQGGIMAAWLASHQDTYLVSAVVTAGSPVAGLGPFPEGAHVLSLENRGDVIPLIEGEANPDSRNHVTVTFDDGGPSMVDNHDLARYVAGGAAVDAATHPSIVDELARLRSLGFLADDAEGGARTQVFQVIRAPMS